MAQSMYQVRPGDQINVPGTAASQYVNSKISSATNTLEPMQSAMPQTSVQKTRNRQSVRLSLPSSKEEDKMKLAAKTINLCDHTSVLSSQGTPLGLSSKLNDIQGVSTQQDWNLPHVMSTPHTAR